MPAPNNFLDFSLLLEEFAQRGFFLRFRRFFIVNVQKWAVSHLLFHLRGRIKLRILHQRLLELSLELLNRLSLFLVLSLNRGIALDQLMAQLIDFLLKRFSLPLSLVSLQFHDLVIPHETRHIVLHFTQLVILRVDINSLCQSHSKA